MNRFFATFMRAYQSPETGGEGTAGGGALDLESRISAVLSGNEGEGGLQAGHGVLHPVVRCRSPVPAPGAAQDRKWPR